jgi:capsular exopolysaccharide synthesis family protein
MDRIIQPHSGTSAVAAKGPTVVVPTYQPGPGAAPKVAADFLRALRRRFWLVGIITVLIGALGAAWVVRLPAIYKATAQVLIEPPKYDAALTAMVAHGGFGATDRETNDKYVPNHLAYLRSRVLAEIVLSDPANGNLGYGGVDPIQDFLEALLPRQLPGTTTFDVALEGPDPERTAHLLNALVHEFARRAKDENREGISRSRGFALESLKKMRSELVKIDDDIRKVLELSPIFAPDGKSRLEQQFNELTSTLTHKRMQLDQLAQEDRMLQLWPDLKRTFSPYDQSLAELRQRKRQLENKLAHLQRTISKNEFNRDPATLYFARDLDRTLDDMETLERASLNKAPMIANMMKSHAEEEIRKLELKAKSLLDRMQQSMPQFQTYLTLLKDRDLKAQSISAMQARLLEFQLLTESQNLPVQIQREASTPTSPVRPKRPLYIAIITFLGLVLGIGLVCLLEFLDKSVKVPEHLTFGLGLPLFGVLPRMRRLSSFHKNGHVWTLGAPHSIEAESFRNVRASLISATGPKGSIRTLLVTSAKAGEGKSTTALNLAATCARAGERVLLMDVDLRRPSLGGVFTDGRDPELGLVDILRGDLPWQRTLIHTELANLDFMPTGDPTGVPIEVLGTRELRQLMAAVSGHYHRVILDGPAVLGMADCRMLGRVVDSAILVVRSGAHELRPLQRAKAMLDQSNVPIAGVVFNGLIEDLENWSSYGSGPLEAFAPLGQRANEAPHGLAAPVEAT